MDFPAYLGAHAFAMTIGGLLVVKKELLNAPMENCSAGVRCEVFPGHPSCHSSLRLKYRCLSWSLFALIEEHRQGNPSI